MTRRTRSRVLSSVAFLAIGIGYGLLWFAFVR